MTKINQDDGLPPRTINVNGVTLVAEDLPPQGRGKAPGEMWAPVVAKLLLLGEESMRVDWPGHTGKNTYQSIARYLRLAKEKRVYAAQRKGVCYLVRAKGAK